MKIVLLSPTAKMPSRGTSGSAGLDLYASAEVVVPATRVVGDRASIGRVLVPTGIAVSIPRGCVGRIGSRSGLSTTNNVEVGAGWIDPDYRGEVLVELKNFGSEEFRVQRGRRIAQLFIVKVMVPRLEVVKALGKSRRSARGFGSTGVF